MNAQHRLRSDVRLGVLALLLLAFALRGCGLDAQELRGDEAFGYFFSLASPGEIVARTLQLREPHPVASYWLQHGWLALAGHSEYALRFSGVWWGVIAVVLMVALARQLRLAPDVGLLAAAMMALSPYAIWHAQDARMYSMSLALTMLSTQMALRWWQISSYLSQIGVAAAYLGVTWIALHTQYFALYVVAAQQFALLGWAIAARAWQRLLVWWGVSALLLLAWLPWLLPAWSILTEYYGNGDSPSLLAAIRRAASAFAVGETVTPEASALWAALLLAGAVLGAWSLWRGHGPRRATLWLLASYALVPLAATWISAQSRPIFNERYLVAAVPPVYILVAAGAGAVQRRMIDGWRSWLGRIVVAAVLVGMGLGLVRQVSDPAYSKTRGWRELAAALERLTIGIEADTVRLAQNYPDPTLWYYYQGNVPHVVLPPVAHDAPGAEEEVAFMVEEGVMRVLLVEQPSPDWDANGIGRSALAQHYALGTETTVAGWPVSVWLRPPEVLDALDVRFMDGLQLVGSYVAPRTLSAAGVVAVHLQWRYTAAAVDNEVAVSVQLLDKNGALVAQQDRPLAMASNTTALVTSYAILLPATLPAGEYALNVVVYDPELPGAPRRWTEQDLDYVSLGSVTVDVISGGTE